MQIILSTGLAAGRRRTPLAIWLGAGLALGTSPLAAQPVEGEALAEITAEGAKSAQNGYQPVRSKAATLTDRPILDVPQAVAVVTQQVIADQRIRTLDEALANVSGVTQANTLGGTQDAFIRRGFGDNRDGSILRDGLRTALPRSFSATTERVEVLKGPASALYGILDPGGLVNVVTKVPSFVRANSVLVSGTSFNGGSAQVDLTGPIGQTGFAYRLIAEHSDEQYWRNFGTNQTDLFAPSLAYRGETTTARIAYEYSRYKVPFDRGTIFTTLTGRAVPVPRSWRFDEKYNTTTGETHVLRADVSQAIGDHWTLDGALSYSHNWYNDFQARVLSFNPRTLAITRRADATQDSNFDVLSTRLNATGRYSFLGMDHEILLGGTYDTSDVVRTRLVRGPTSSAFSILSPTYGLLARSFSVTASDSNQQEHIRNGSFYAQDSITLFDRLIVTGGFSVQSFTDRAGRGVPFSLNTNAEGTQTVPRVGLVYKLAPSLSLYASFSESFRPNSSISSNIGALPPEQGVSYEGGLKLEVAEGVTATLAYFDITKTNVQYAEIVNGITTTKTAGKVGSRGIELDVAGRLTEDWSVIGSFGYTDAIVLDDPVLAGKRLLNVGKLTGSAFLTHDFGEVLGGRVRAGLGGRYESRRPGDASNTFSMPAYAVADGFVSWEKQMQDYRTVLQLNVKNIFDTTYYSSSIGTNLSVAVGEPMRAVLTARIDF